MVKVDIDVDAATAHGPFQPIYRFFGADEPNYAYLPDGQVLLGDIGSLGPAQPYFRAHNLMVTGDGEPALKWGSTNMYREDARGNAVYDWTIVDRIFDTYLEHGVKPYVQIGFMPRDLSSRPEPYRHQWRPGDPYDDIFTGWAYPPKDYDKWRELVFQWARHSTERYGPAEVESWYWQVWNEANIGYWKGTAAEFRKLHDYAIDGLRRAIPNAKIGGADTAGPGGRFQRDFLDHTLRGINAATGRIGPPLDFVSFHAKGAPTLVDGRVRMGIAAHLRDVRDGFQLVAAYPQYRSAPIIIGESDPDGCAACSSDVYPQNAYRNSTLYAAYLAATFARIGLLADLHGVNLEGVLTWAFEFEDQPIFAGLRVMATRGGVNVPAFNLFRMLGRLSGQRLSVTSTHEVPLDTMLSTGVRGSRPDVTAVAARDGTRIAVLAWHYHDDDVPGPDAAITVTVRGLPAATTGAHLIQYRIDERHSNAYAAWQQMGSPAAPTVQQLASLQAAGQLQTTGPPQPVTVSGGTTTVRTRLPRQGVALLIIS